MLAPLPAGEPTDAELIAEVLAGDRGRFAVLVRRHNQQVFRACRAVLRNDQDAEDAVQTAWLNAYRALGSYRADAAFRTWVTRIAVNEAAARLRARPSAIAIATEDLEADAAPAGPEQDLFAKELSRMLEREISALPEGLRSVLVLRDVVELDTAETATSLGIAEENVRVRLHRARHALTQRLTASMEELLQVALPDLYRFDGERCARTVTAVMTRILG